MPPLRRTPLPALLLTALTACTPSFKRCPAPPNMEKVGALPTLSDTGLYADAAHTALAAGVLPYRPNFELWSDGATKKRWIALPEGAQIDTHAMDAWQFPRGTKLWKEFARDGKALETRFMQKVGDRPEDWLAVSYIWDGAGKKALATPAGAKDVLGTSHDVPSSQDCFGCHNGTESRVLGVSAIQLPATAPAGELSLAMLTDTERLTAPPAAAPVIPGDADARAMLGYLHANCAHCHNQQRPPAGALRCWDPRKKFDLSLRTDALASLADTPVYKTALEKMVVAGKPEKSPLYKRTRGDLRFFQSRMPSLGTETLDPAVLGMMERWIARIH
jgi:hypothetical protein